MRFDWFQTVDAEVQKACAEECIHFYEIAVGPHHVQYHVSRDGFISRAYRKLQAERLERCVERLEATFKGVTKKPAKGTPQTPDLHVIEVAANTGDEFLAPYLVVRVKETGVWQ